MPEITCATCGLPLDPSESTGQGFNGHMHLHVDRCVELLREENAALREDKARLVEALDSLLPGLVIDLRYCSEDDDRDALRSRVQTVTEALDAARKGGKR